jgi:hypothetical protein
MPKRNFDSVAKMKAQIDETVKEGLVQPITPERRKRLRTPGALKFRQLPEGAGPRYPRTKPPRPPGFERT